ncbi:hypothetical protein [Nitrosomonas communis]|nr:hypothetical protein [Nitrosomonas communis]
MGETHRQPGSIQFFQSLITKYLQQKRCLTVALEIASSQQFIIDKIMQSGGNVEDIQIAPMIDHPAYRAMIADLAKISRNGACVKLIAIDGNIESGVGRDEWMAKEILQHVGLNPLIALLGNLHALKKIDWNKSISKVSPFVAEILVSQSHQIRTYPQIWIDKACNINYRLITSDEAEIIEIINKELISLLNASEIKTVNNIVDGIILWECE